jgi:hypothetical protein
MVVTEGVTSCSGQNTCKTFCIDSRAYEFMCIMRVKEYLLKSLTYSGFKRFCIFLWENGVKLF